jgi:hypothetical protein
MPTPLLRALLVTLVAALLLAPTAAAAPADPGTPAATAAQKACKRKKGESKKRWLKRCKCTKYKRGETRKKFKKRCPGAKVPKRKAPGGGGGGTAPPVPAPPAGAPAPAQSDVDKVTAALVGTQLQYFTYSNTSGASDNERYKFCSGTFSYVRNRIAISGIAYDSSGAGTWRITQAAVNPDGVSGTATLHYDLTSLQWGDVDPAPAQSGDVPMTFNGSKVDFGGRVYDATKVAC